MEGRVRDTNAPFIASRLVGRGIATARFTAVPDRAEAIAGALGEALQRGADPILVTGGLGPTSDDITREAAAKAFGVPLVRSAEAVRAIELWCREHGRSLADVADVNLRQADIPDRARMLPNPRGTAPGFELDGERGSAAFFPGVPHEAEPMIDAWLDRRIPRRTAALRRTLSLFGHGESDTAGALDPLLARYPGLRIHYLATFPTLEVTLEADDAETLDAVWSEALRHLSHWAYALEPASLPAALGARLAARGETLSLAESCTGGRASHLITSVPGSSGYFRLGVTTYADGAKERLLGVPAAILSRHGAVSVETAAAMASGVRALGGTDWAAAVTGIAGPDGGSDDKPVGFVCFAVDGPTGLTTHRRTFTGFGRPQIQELAAHTALWLLLQGTKGQPNP